MGSAWDCKQSDPFSSDRIVLNAKKKEAEETHILEQGGKSYLPYMSILRIMFLSGGGKGFLKPTFGWHSWILFTAGKWGHYKIKLNEYNPKLFLTFYSCDAFLKTAEQVFRECGSQIMTRSLAVSASVGILISTFPELIPLGVGLPS